jgi:hypothetical protein
VRGQLVGLSKILAVSLERLFPEHSASVAFHRGIVRSNKVCRDHPLNFVFRSDPHEPRDDRTILTVVEADRCLCHPVGTSQVQANAPPDQRRERLV